MKTAITITAFTIAVFLLFSDTKITFNPFSIQVQNWIRGIGCLMIIVGIALIPVGNHVKSYNEGLKSGANIGVQSLLQVMQQRGLISEHVAEELYNAVAYEQETEETNP